MNKPFTELPAPKRTHRLSIVAVWNPIDYYCEHARCKWPDVEEVTECPVCGRWLCDKCFGEKGTKIPLARMRLQSVPVRSAVPCCDDCNKLTPDERQAIMDLREKMGGAM